MRRCIWVFFALIFSAGIFSYGVAVGALRIYPFEIAKDAFKYLSTMGKVSEEHLELASCSLDRIEEVPLKSKVIIGHAYGSASSANEFDYIARKVESFLETNRDKIDSVIFTGDVFYQPSLNKWDRLYQQFIPSFKIQVVPGNHDVGTITRADVFQMSPFRWNNLRSLIHEENMILENSSTNGWLLNDQIINAVENTDVAPVLLLRHHVPVIELKKYANSQAQISKELPTAEEFVQKFEDTKNVIVVAGDSGAFPWLPRLTCNRHKHVTFITNGIGEVNGDSVLIVHGGKIYYHEI